MHKIFDGATYLCPFVPFRPSTYQHRFLMHRMLEFFFSMFCTDRKFIEVSQYNILHRARTKKLACSLRIHNTKVGFTYFFLQYLCFSLLVTRYFSHDISFIILIIYTNHNILYGNFDDYYEIEVKLTLMSCFFLPLI